MSFMVRRQPSALYIAREPTPANSLLALNSVVKREMCNELNESTIVMIVLERVHPDMTNPTPPIVDPAGYGVVV